METVDTSTTESAQLIYVSTQAEIYPQPPARSLWLSPLHFRLSPLMVRNLCEHDSEPYEDAGATVADSAGNALDASQLVVSSNVNVSSRFLRSGLRLHST